MNGTDVVGGLLRGSPELVALVPASSIRALVLPPKTVLPMIAAKRISRSGPQMLARVAARHVRERVQVTVQTADYRSLEIILGLVVSICSDRIIGELGDLTNIAVLSAGGGPDFLDDTASLFMGSHDFYVDFNEPA